MPKPPQLTSFDGEKQWLYFELPSYDRAPHPISKAKYSHLLEKAHISRLYLGWPLKVTQTPHATAARLTKYLRGHGRWPSPDPQNTYSPKKHTPMTSSAISPGQRSGPLSTQS
ncbi:hypothetical protein ATANTOWER_020788 [Ataeniobius toweri]|uniref:Uncharacterized protein n=1 Tax=Ataeniobius toweri TaxID=208326 RepID=A0ABU7CL04_9TELE|nr:hypothetical protein [Ataeniobius toweri]